MDAEQLPHEIYATVGSKEATAEETRRTEMNYELYKELANRSMDLKCGKANTYQCRSIAEGCHELWSDSG